jgi:tetratricopeptide (TPR) repeat protein
MRVFFAKAEPPACASNRRRRRKISPRIASDFKLEDLSPLLLGATGDYLLGKGRFDPAAAFYQRLLDDFPKSQMVDFAYNGLGEIAYQKKDYPKALRYFADGTEKIAAVQKLKDITLGRAKTLFALGKLDEAQKGFEQVASVREWRGEATAFSVYSLGQIAAKRGKWAEANAYFQRVYVGYQKFLPWVAKAYMRAARVLKNSARHRRRRILIANYSATKSSPISQKPPRPGNGWRRSGRDHDNLLSRTPHLVIPAAAGRRGTWQASSGVASEARRR